MHETALNGYNSEILVHHGVKGQKWGLRRYQNPDGTLTELGRKRYGTSERMKAQIESVESKKRDRNIRGAFTNQELKEKIERLKLEKELRELTDSEVTPGKKFVKTVLEEVGKDYSKKVLTGAALYGTKAAISKEFNRKDFGEALFNGGPKKK